RKRLLSRDDVPRRSAAVGARPLSCRDDEGPLSLTPRSLPCKPDASAAVRQRRVDRCLPNGGWGTRRHWHEPNWLVTGYARTRTDGFPRRGTRDQRGMGERAGPPHEKSPCRHARPWAQGDGALAFVRGYHGARGHPLHRLGRVDGGG